MCWEELKNKEKKITKSKQFKKVIVVKQEVVNISKIGKAVGPMSKKSDI